MPAIVVKKRTGVSIPADRMVFTRVKPSSSGSIRSTIRTSNFSVIAEPRPSRPFLGRGGHHPPLLRGRFSDKRLFLRHLRRVRYASQSHTTVYCDQTIMPPTGKCNAYVGFLRNVTKPQHLSEGNTTFGLTRGC